MTNKSSSRMGATGGLRWMVGAVLLICLGSVDRISGAAATDAETIQRQSQAFSDASASGDAKVLANLLDDDVLFMEESGDIDTKKDIVSSAKPSPDGISNHLVQTDFMVKLHGDVAVTSFTDNATTTIYGQQSKSRFRSTEVWQKKDGSWKMISSQTLALPEDPPPSDLPTANLD